MVDDKLLFLLRCHKMYKCLHMSHVSKLKCVVLGFLRCQIKLGLTVLYAMKISELSGVACLIDDLFFCVSALLTAEF